MAHRMTKACSITVAERRRVMSRDHGLCVLCGSNLGQPNAHYIARSHGGLGIAENLLTLCPDCHREYDNGPNRKQIREVLRGYLMSKYDDWNEDKLVYHKYGGCNQGTEEEQANPEYGKANEQTR